MADGELLAFGAILVTIAIFLATVIYHAGRLAARVESLELWRAEITHSLDAIHAAIRHVELVVRGEET